MTSQNGVKKMYTPRQIFNSCRKINILSWAREALSSFGSFSADAHLGHIIQIKMSSATDGWTWREYLIGTSIAIGVATASYLVYFDYKRRHDTEFRKTISK